MSIKPPKSMTLETLTSFETYIFDCDGVIWGIPAEDSQRAVATVNYLLGLGKRVMFVTNNSNKTRKQFLKQLQGLGVDFGRRSESEKLKMMISASFTTSAFLKENDLKHPFIITSDGGILSECRDLGITEYYATITDDGKVQPEFESLSMLDAGKIVKAHPHIDSIVVGWDMCLTALKIASAINFVRWIEDVNHCRIPIIAASGDAGGVLGTDTFEDQKVKLRAIGNGAMADIITRSFDPPLEYVDMGKPSDALLGMLRSPQAYGVDLSKALMVGDTLQTDIVFGNRGGMRTLLVLTGVTSQEELDIAVRTESSARRPHYVLPSLGKFVKDGEIPSKA
jgi:HAD superfamily hydrolase (TIGR01450 family)